MLTLRCTAKLLRRLGTSPGTEAIEPTTRLGDWYANLLFTRPAQLVLCVSERTLFPVVMPARAVDTLPARFARAVCEVLQRMGLAGDAVRAEEQAMAVVAVGRTTSKRVLGSMNDFARMLDAYRERGADLIEIALHLADAPCGPLDMESPRRATLALFAGSHLVR